MYLASVVVVFFSRNENPCYFNEFIIKLLLTHKQYTYVVHTLTVLKWPLPRKKKKEPFNGTSSKYLRTLKYLKKKQTKLRKLSSLK